MWPNQTNRNPQSNYDRANLQINVAILAVTVGGLLYLNQLNVALNARNVQLNTQNVINNKKSADNGKQILEVLNEINQNFSKENNHG